MATIIVSIGRNMGTANPLPSGKQELNGGEWSAFKDEVTATLTGTGGTVVFKGEGLGIYEGEYEHAYTVIVTVKTLPWSLWLEFENSLGLLAYRYGQDSIAVTTGDTWFASAPEVTA
tara:strand:- start:206 stop:556 length:351 start_codon:yes stop_codon:yes gene_type:complete